MKILIMILAAAFSSCKDEGELVETRNLAESSGAVDRAEVEKVIETNKDKVNEDSLSSVTQDSTDIITNTITADTTANSNNSNDNNSDSSSMTGDTVIPTVNISTVVNAVNALDSIDFSFTGQDDVELLRLECSVDGGAWNTCTSPHTVVVSTEGAHSFKLRSVDTSDNLSIVSEVTWNTVFPELYVKENVVYLALNQEFTIQAIGGSTPFNFNLTGGGSFDSGSMVFTAPNTAGSSTVDITDKHGKTATVSFNVIDVPALGSAAFWLDASSITGHADGASVQNWYDISGQNSTFSQSTSTARPIYKINGTQNLRPSVRFDGVNHFLSSNATLGANASARSLFVVVDNGDYSKESTIGQYGENQAYGDSWGISFVSRFDKTGGRLAIGGAYLGTPSYAGGNMAGEISPSNKTQIISLIYDGTQDELYVNGKNSRSMAITHATSTVVGFKLGSAVSGSNKFSGDIAEVIAYSSALTADDRDKLFCYLANKYDVKVKNAFCDISPIGNDSIVIPIKVLDNHTISLVGEISPTYSMASGSLGTVNSVGLFTAMGAAGSASVLIEDVDSSVFTINFDVVEHEIPTIWFKADAISGISDGSVVTKWADSSGNGYDSFASASTKAPIYKENQLNGLPVVRFDGVDDFLATNKETYVNGTGARTIVAVITNANDSGTDLRLIAEYGTTWNATQLYGLSYRTGVSPYEVGNIYGGSTFNGGTAPSASAMLLVIQYDGSDDYLYVNGAFSGSNSVVLNTVSWSSLKIGSNHTGSGGFFDGDIAEFMYFDSFLTSSQRQALEAYLQTKYGIN